MQLKGENANFKEEMKKEMETSKSFKKRVEELEKDLQNAKKQLDEKSENAAQLQDLNEEIASIHHNVEKEKINQFERLVVQIGWFSLFPHHEILMKIRLLDIHENSVRKSKSRTGRNEGRTHQIGSATGRSKGSTW